MPRRRTGSAFLYCQVWLENLIAQEENPCSLSFRTAVFPTVKSMAGPCLVPCQFHYFIGDHSKAVSAGMYDIIATVCHHSFSSRPNLTDLKDVGTMHHALDRDPGNTYKERVFHDIELSGDVVSVRFLVIKVSPHVLIRTLVDTSAFLSVGGALYQTT